MLQKYLDSFSELKSRIRADKELLQQQRERECAGNPSEKNTAPSWIGDAGLQSMTAIRWMRFVRDSGIPKGGEVMSRLIRYIFGMEIHWNANIDSGMIIENGPGLVISRSATIGPGCILCQHVTLGEMRDPKTKITGAPTLEKNVFVGPGAILMGPITIGESARIEAGCIVTTSIPPFAVVKPAESEYKQRK